MKFITYKIYEDHIVIVWQNNDGSLFAVIGEKANAFEVHLNWR